MSKLSKKSSRHFLTKMLISSKEWDLVEQKNREGAWFCHCDRKNGGRRTVVLGTKDKDARYHAEILIHEVIEIMLSQDGKRYVGDWVRSRDHSRYFFSFDHDYLDGVGATLLTALLTSGMFELKEMR